MHSVIANSEMSAGRLKVAVCKGRDAIEVGRLPDVPGLGEDYRTKSVHVNYGDSLHSARLAAPFNQSYRT
jgi:hypothetical protein